jgi:hypothetical protein
MIFLVLNPRGGWPAIQMSSPETLARAAYPVPVGVFVVFVIDQPGLPMRLGWGARRRP